MHHHAGPIPRLRTMLVPLQLRRLRHALLQPVLPLPHALAEVGAYGLHLAQGLVLVGDVGCHRLQQAAVSLLVMAGCSGCTGQDNNRAQQYSSTAQYDTYYCTTSLVCRRQYIHIWSGGTYNVGGGWGSVVAAQCDDPSAKRCNVCMGRKRVPCAA
jgi:hypothetical protein